MMGISTDILFLVAVVVWVLLVAVVAPRLGIKT
jgi:hypothetical protein